MLGVPRGRWSEVDRKLAIALTLHDKDVCPGGCGHYLDETVEMDGFHTAHVVVCDACSARDRHNDEAAKTGTRTPGSLTYITYEPGED